MYNQDNGRILKRLKRDDFVYIGGKLIRYPIQNNLGSLPPAERDACLIDIVKTKLVSLDQKDSAKSPNLDDYLVSEWGEKLCNIFFRPYIHKMLAFPTGKLAFHWVSSKIPPFRNGVDIDQILRGEEPKDSGINFLVFYYNSIVLFFYLKHKLPSNEPCIFHEVL